MSTPLTVKQKKLHLDFTRKTYVMGILNVTPDSFSDGGKYDSVERAVRHAKEMVENGADLIDIGGESTRPGAPAVGKEEELNRVLPVIEAVAAEVDVPISIDTYKAEVAKKAIEAGASIINDVWGAKADGEMADVAAAYDVPIILMHNRHNKQYQDLIADMIADLQESIALCKKAGVREEQIILDPGIGFAKTYDHNLEVMRRLDELTALPYPVLLGTSRKSFIAKTLDLPVDERVEGTGATICLGIAKGCQIIRVHDVKEMSRMVKMMDAMLGKGRETIG
ncbi:dihydropteroate synthase [Halalkalibacterium ligniniphilum]|uniref:dihydropteroate synthase n=1 Tax=Halalkalibacterium ligniniphilum TaxID=1134413 RepID=UPI000382F04A|nr:dihydropteroate synthase [Halalkalibacterium ligniniphilum]